MTVVVEATQVWAFPMNTTANLKNGPAHPPPPPPHFMCSLKSQFYFLSSKASAWTNSSLGNNFNALPVLGNILKQSPALSIAYSFFTRQYLVNKPENYYVAHHFQDTYFGHSCRSSHPPGVSLYL